MTIDDVSPARIAEKIRVNAVSGCWEWQACTVDGYGRLSWEGRTQRAHRVIYAIVAGQMPTLGLDHLCRVRHCVNPAHLEPVTPRENILRSPVGFAALNFRKTRCPRGHLYDQANTYFDGYGRRYCRACNRASRARRRLSLRADAPETS